MHDKYIYNRPETGKPEVVLPERWRWEAHYTDNTVLRQFDDATQTFHQIREIEQPRLHVFKMVNASTGKFYEIDWHPARKLIHKYMNFVFNAGTPDESRLKCYAFGYETHFEGASHKVILVILPDDNVVLTEDTNRIQLT